jgi:hypothetical protein
MNLWISGWVRATGLSVANPYRQMLPEELDDRVLVVLTVHIVKDAGF